MSNEIMRQLFTDKFKEQFRQNEERFGSQGIEHLLQVCQVQLGHITNQFLKGSANEKFRIELVHLAAVLYDLYGR